MLYTERLKLDTRSDHSKVESSAISKSILSNPSVKEYIQFLHCWNIVYSITLPSLNLSVFQNFLLENGQRLKKDLEALSRNKKFLINYQNTTFTEKLSELSIFYVLTGAMLGGGIIAKKLEIGKLEEIQNNLRFLSMDINSLHSHWVEVKNFINSSISNEAQYEILVNDVKKLFNIIFIIFENEVK